MEGRGLHAGRPYRPDGGRPGRGGRGLHRLPHRRIHRGARERPAGPRRGPAILADADARAFVYTTEVGAKIVDLDALENTDVIVALGEPAPRAPSSPGRRCSIPGRPPCRRVPRAADDLTIVGYTSGTTGQPKGVMHTERSMVRILRHMPVHFNARPRSRCAFTGTLSFVAGIWGVLLPHLYLGGEISFMAGLDARRVVRPHGARGQQPHLRTDPATPTSSSGRSERRPEVLDTLSSAVHSGSKLPAPTVRALVDVIGARFVESLRHDRDRRPGDDDRGRSTGHPPARPTTSMRAPAVRCTWPT